MTHLQRYLSKSLRVVRSSLIALSGVFGAFFSLEKIRFLIAKNRCFSHIVNLACKAVLQAMTKLDFAAKTAADYILTAASSETFIETLVS